MDHSKATHLVQLLDRQAQRTPAHPALCWLDDGCIRTLTWADYRHQVRATACAFLDMGVERGGTVAILAPNIVEHYVADLASLLCGAATVSLYPTLSDDQLAHILADSRPVVVVTADTVAADRIRRALPRGSSVRFVCVQAGDHHDGSPYDSWAELLQAGEAGLAEKGAELDRRLAGSPADDVATYVYTSGTTGMPKGVIMTHANLLFEIDAFDQAGLFVGGYRVVSYLPLAHIAERLWSLYFPLKTGGNVLLCPDQSQLPTCLRLQRPSYFMGVPRVWEKLRAAATMILSTEKYAARAAEVAADREMLARAWSLSQEGGLAPEDRARVTKAREGVLADLRRDLGLDWTVSPVSGAAALPEDLRDFWCSIGVDLTQAYGLSETSGVALWERNGGGKRGSVGVALPGFEVAIAEDGEILIKGPGNTPGYRNIDNDKSQLFIDGWLATGDVGHLDESGRLYVTDRKKELIVSGAGKNISPTTIEDKIAGHGFIHQVVAVGDGRPYITGLMTVDERALRAFARAHSVDGELPDLLEHPAIVQEAQRIVDLANERLSRPEQVKRFRLVADEWSVASGDLTPTFKMRRRSVLARYSDVVESLYEQPRENQS